MPAQRAVSRAIQATLPATRAAARPAPRAVFWLDASVGEGAAAKRGATPRCGDCGERKSAGAATVAFAPPALRRVRVDQDRPPRARAADVWAEQARMKQKTKKAAQGADDGRGEFPRGDPPAGALRTCTEACRRRSKRAVLTRTGARPNHGDERSRGRPAAKRREPRHASRSPGQHKKHRAKPRGGRHALRPAAVSRGLVQPGSCAGCAAHNPPGWPFSARTK